MSLDHLLLGLLQEPASGYDLKARFDNEIRYFWAAELSQIYGTLQRLERSGSLSSGVEPSSKGPDRKVYSLTPQGRAALREWLDTEPIFGTERFEYLAQLYFMAAARDANRALRFITDLRRTLTERLRTFKQIEAEWTGDRDDFARDDEFYRYLALRAGIRTMTARIEWCNEALARIHQRMGRKSKREQARGSKGAARRTKRATKGRTP